MARYLNSSYSLAVIAPMQRVLYEIVVKVVRLCQVIAFVVVWLNSDHNSFSRFCTSKIVFISKDYKFYFVTSNLSPSPHQLTTWKWRIWWRIEISHGYHRFPCICFSCFFPQFNIILVVGVYKQIYAILISWSQGLGAQCLLPKLFHICRKNSRNNSKDL
jgi:hypothetical protein